MKKAFLFPTLAVMALLLSACGSAPAVASSSQAFAAINTAVAMTVAAAPQSVSLNATDTATPLPTSTPVFIPTDTPTPSTVPTDYSYSAVSCDDATYIKDVTIPDGTVLSPGQSFVKTWKVENTGGCNWTSDYSLVYTGGGQLDGSDTAIGKTVQVGRKIDVSVSLTAPDADGTYYGYWSLADSDGNTFGTSLYVEIVVAEPTATPTFTATPTATIAPTTAATATATSAASLPIVNTATLLPLATPTAVVTAKPTLSPSPTAAPSSTISPTSTAKPAPTVAPTATPTVKP